MRPVTVTPGDPLAGSLDMATILRDLTRAYVIKGMFFSRHVTVLGPAFEALLPTLDAPPRFGRYVPFTDYPQADYVRVAAAVAARVYPSLSPRESFRRVGRDDFTVFAESTLGKVVLAAVGDAQAALLKTPYTYEKLASGDWTISAEPLEGRSVRITFAPDPGSWEYKLGQIEGVVRAFGGRPTTTVRELDGKVRQFDVVIG